MRAVALVTGASGGIGADLARVLAVQGHDLALVARSADRLAALADEIAATGRPRPLVVPCDLSRRDAADTIAAHLGAEDARVAILVNNAGWGLLGPVAESDADALLDIVDVNMRALLALTRRFLPDLVAARGRILNVGSIASYMPGPGMAVYYASKAFVSAFSRALGEELKTAGVSVTLLQPGVTRTGFQRRAGTMRNGTGGASSRAVAEAGVAAMLAGRRIVVPGLGNKIGALALPLVPDALLLPVIHRFQRRRR